MKLCALSSGHGPRGRGLEGFCKTLDFHDHFGGVKNGEKKHEQSGWTWSDVGLWSSRPAQNDLLTNPEKIRGFPAQQKQKNRKTEIGLWPLAWPRRGARSRRITYIASDKPSTVQSSLRSIKMATRRTSSAQCAER